MQWIQHTSAAGLMAAALLAPQASLAAANPPAKQPNILWIIAEDLNPCMGCYGDPVNTGHTPVIDRFAADGVLFSRAYATAPVCSAARSALITGVHAATINAQNHRSSRAPDGTVVPEAVRINLPDGMKTVPELMRQAGYFTFNSGKDDYNFHYDRRALYCIGTKDDYVAGMNGWQGNMDKNMMSDAEGAWVQRPDKTQPWFGQIQIMGGKSWDNKYVRPGELLPKGSITPPPYFPNSPDQRNAWTQHFNTARGMDARIEGILDRLEADGELDNTVVFFFSDHGSPTSLRHKQFCYEGGLQVPLLVKGPMLKAGTIRKELVTLLDVSATTLALGQARMPNYLAGQNLFGNTYQPADYVLGSRDRCDYTIDRIRSVRTDPFRYIKNYFPERPMMQAGYRDHKAYVVDLKKLHEAGKLTPYQDQHWFGVRPVEELYDLEKDPHQMNNLAENPEYQEMLKKHRMILSDWEKSSDHGIYPEPAVQLKGTYELWKTRSIFQEADVNPEYDQFR